VGLALGQNHPRSGTSLNRRFPAVALPTIKHRHQLMTTATAKPKIWVPGDWNAFFGFGTNILVNLLTLSALLRFVLKMPDDMVFKHILPAAGMMMCMST